MGLERALRVPRRALGLLALSLGILPAAAIAQNDARLRSLLAEGRSLLEAGKLEAARARLEEAVRVGPEQAEGHQLLGLLHERNGNLPAAALAYERTLRLSPERVRTRP